MERGTGALSAVQEVSSQFGIPVISIATLEDLAAFLRARGDMAQQLQSVERYRKEYGVTT
jgi:orotate phosphoribosyltransferase